MKPRWRRPWSRSLRRRESGKGTGLGLSMVHGLTAQSGGAMHISSQLGKGTVVTLWLPRATQEDCACGAGSSK